MNSNDVGLPEVTPSEVVTSFCGSKLYYVPALKSYFIGSWKVHALPMLIYLAYLSAMLYAFLCVALNAFEENRSKFAILAIFLHIYYLLSVILTIEQGPGYLPFYYNRIKDQNRQTPTKYLQCNPPSGVITSEEQLKFALHSGDIPHCQILMNARRYVISPRFYFAIGSVWIGRRNMKLYLLAEASLFTIYCIYLYCGAAFVLSFTFEFGITNEFIEVIGFFLVSGIFFIIELLDLSRTIRYITFEQTDLNCRIKPCENRPLLSNWEEICGPLYRIPLWILPIPTFIGVKDEDILTNAEKQSIV